MNLGGVIHLNKTGVCLICGAFLIFFIYMATNNSTWTLSSKPKINLSHLLKVALKAAENGGIEVVATKDNLAIKSKGLTKEGMEDRVTTADFLSHCSIMGTLKHSYPDLTVISEEAKTECDPKQAIDFSKSKDPISDLEDQWENQSDITVWIDPLDATHEYTEKLYDYVTTMVCVAVRGKPLIGIIHRPFSKTTSWAWVGRAKSPDLVPLKREAEKTRIIISRSHSGPIENVLKKGFQNYELVIAAGAGYKALKVATGEVDAYLHITAIKKWDICAGNAIIDAVGGKMTTKFDQIIDYKDLTNVKNEDGLVATLTNHDAFIGKL